MTEPALPGAPGDAGDNPDCPSCGKPRALCLCDDVAPVACRTQLVILQHPQEQDRLLGTARLTAACVSGAIVKVGLSWPSLSKLLGHTVDPARWAVLYLGSARIAPGAAGGEVVVGTGIAGNAAAWALARHYPVTLYERDARAGGHSHTVSIDYDGTPIDVDVGFIVYNELNYPDLTALFEHLGVETLESCMSFSVSADRGRFEWMGGGGGALALLRGLFAQPANLASPSYLRMLRDIVAFNAASVRDRLAGRLEGLTLGDYLAARPFAPRLLTDYLAPMGAAIWSASEARILDFPAENFVAFFDNHRLLQFNRPVWRSVKGGSRSYVARLTAGLRDTTRLSCPVTAIARTPGGVHVSDASGRRERYDHVVLATHSDEALALLADAHADERTVLGAIPYAPNEVFLHRDTRLMPKRRHAWASWNFLRWTRDGDALNDVAVTYWMNRLQGIDADKPLFVSLNPPFAPDPALTFGRYLCRHPQYDAAAFAAQRQLDRIQGQRRTWFCGAWTGYGFHEDGVRSGLAIAEALGASIPWRPQTPQFRQAAE